MSNEFKIGDMVRFKDNEDDQWYRKQHTTGTDKYTVYTVVKESDYKGTISISYGDNSVVTVYPKRLKPVQQQFIVSNSKEFFGTYDNYADALEAAKSYSVLNSNTEFFVAKKLSIVTTKPVETTVETL